MANDIPEGAAIFMWVIVALAIIGLLLLLNEQGAIPCITCLI
ncbi:hypothetical protein ACFLQ2_03180 [archaeon]